MLHIVFVSFCSFFFASAAFGILDHIFFFPLISVKGCYFLKSKHLRTLHMVVQEGITQSNTSKGLCFNQTHHNYVLIIKLFYRWQQTILSKKCHSIMTIFKKTTFSNSYKGSYRLSLALAAMPVLLGTEWVQSELSY